MPDKLSTHEYYDLLNRGAWFRAIPEDLKTDLLNLAQIKVLRTGEFLFRRGDKPAGIYAVVKGSLRVTGVNENGKEAILAFVEPPNWFGEIALFDRLDRTHSALAETPTTLLHLPQKGLETLLAAKPHFWRDFGVLLCFKLRLAFRAVEDATLLPAPLRLARRLVVMAEGYGDFSGQARRAIHIQQEQLGMMLGVSRQTVNQILKELEQKGLIATSYGEIQILDMDALKSQAGMLE
ncbi:Crp/Fnr family transcriptional regulator [Hahella sp. HN01]|uniref:Crp/Fnr family transcriptional regulator n=1 Tax=Hahella sp. HN01 TaxID=2847262 RepID=UPI001C1F097D|nr:Crp/Fnr family transcriptional regulator [Hahella sp. HN01]MBU6955863.1 Crp/Fnr family transcriptional regulator [Hahella sp. HN01]